MNSKQPVGIIAAMDSELAGLVAALEQPRQHVLWGLTFYSGLLSGREAVLVKCGVGKVNAARTAQILIDRFEPCALLNSGIAGGIGPGLSVGDAVVADGLVQHDFDVTAFGHARGYLCTGGDSSRPTVFRPDAAVQSALRRAAEEVLGREHVHSGLIATGDQFISGPGQKAAIRQVFSAAAAEMEGGAIAQAAVLSGVPFGVLRVISDLADDTAPDSSDRFEEETARRSARIVKQAVGQL